MHKLHGMFTVVLQARMRHDEEMNLFFPVDACGA